MTARAWRLDDPRVSADPHAYSTDFETTPDAQHAGYNYGEDCFFWKRSISVGNF
jgi:hypothetical protein